MKRTLPHQLESTAPLAVDGRRLTIDEVVAVARLGRPVTLAEHARRDIGRCRVMVEVLLELNEKVYGLTTGFGKLRDKVISPEDTVKLQENLIMSHACGVGKPFSEEVMRAATLLRANTLCRGNSGVRIEVVEQLLNMLNDRIYPFVPEKGSVGASGDLAPLSHLALVLIGHPQGLYLPKARRKDGAAPRHPEMADFAAMPTTDELERVAAEEGWKRFRPIALEAKEGLAVNNGTQIMTAVACLAAYDGYHALRFAELAGALSLEAQRGVRNAFDERLHAVRPQAEQAEVAQRVIDYCDGTQILDLYLNSAHLYRARRHLLDAEEHLSQVILDLEEEGTTPPIKVRSAPRLLEQLAQDLAQVIPTDAEGRPDASYVAEWSGRLPREQIDHFYRLLRPLRERASHLLRELDRRTFPHNEAATKARTALVSAVKQLDDAVPDAPLVQDDYSFRCFPQVLSCAYRAWDHVAEIVEREVNSATDNPLLFPPDPGDATMSTAAYKSWLRANPDHIEACRKGVLGGGNFHGEPIAIAMDYFAIAFAEVANIAERRIAHLVDESLSRGLPAFLIDSSGLNSGFMIPQYTAAALVSENKVLCHPASVDSIPTCASSEDHVSMGTIAARKAAEVLENVLDVIALELLIAYQGLKFRLPLEPGVLLRRVLKTLDANGVKRYDDDRVPYPDFQRIRELMRQPALLELLSPIKETTTSSPRFAVHQLETTAEVSSFAEDVRHGLGHRPKSLQPKYFYDALGSHLFEAICLLPEYYVTAAEAEILQRRGAEIIEAAGLPETVIELGSGSSTKTRHLLEPLLEKRSSVHYLPIDISPSVLERSSRELTQKYSRMRVSALAGDFRSALAHLADAGVERKEKERVLVLFLGSTIGNLEPSSARELIKRVRNLLVPGDAFLLGTDLKKSEKVLVPAYDDALGVTAAFNLNLLVRINRELGGAFDLKTFRHRAIYNAAEGRVEMHLLSRVAQSVAIRQLGMTVPFEAGETIHTESSYKYDHAQIAALARDCGFVHEQTWLDGEERFGVHLLSAV